MPDAIRRAVLVKSTGHQPWHGQIRSAGNGEILASTENYVHRQDAEHALRLMLGDDVTIEEVDEP